MAEKKGGMLENAKKLLAALQKSDRLIDELVTELKISKETLIELATDLYKRGWRIVSDKKQLSLLSDDEDAIPQEAIPVSEIRNRYRIAFISEVRMGSMQAQISMLHWLYNVQFKREHIDFVVLAGGMLLGRPTPTLKVDALPTLRDTEKNEVGEFFVDYAVKHFPKADNGTKTYVMASAREARMQTEGLDPLSTICRFDKDRNVGRADLKYVGALEATFDVRGVRIKVMSPWDDNSPLGISYGPQKNTEKIADELPPHIVVFGGLHERSEIPDYGEHGAYVYTCPSLHTQMRRQSRRGVRPRLGCLILELQFGDDGKFDFNTGFRAHHIRLDQYAVKNDCMQLLGDIPKAKLENGEELMLDWFRKERHISEGALSRRLKINREEVRKHIEHLNNLGCCILFSDTTKQWEAQEIEKEKFGHLDLEYEEVFRTITKFADVSDTHFGSRHDLPEVPKIAVRDAAAAGARRLMHSGDVEEGPGAGGYRGHYKDVKFVSADLIDDYAYANWPRELIKVKKDWPLVITEIMPNVDGRIAYRDVVVESGEVPLQCTVIAGNHDAWETQLTGRCPVRALALREPKFIHYIGAADGKITQAGSYVFDGVFHRLIHPRGGLGYTLSTKLQKQLLAEERRGEHGGRPTVVHLGHWHTAYLLFRDSLGMLVPCFKSEDEFHTTTGLMPSVGMFITELQVDKSNRLTRVVSDYRNYRKLAIGVK